MSKTIGVRELKNRTSRVLKSVREDMVEYVVTLHGEPVAVLRPLDEEEAQRLRRSTVTTSMKEMRVLAREVAEAWISEKSAVEVVDEQRR